MQNTRLFNRIINYLKGKDMLLPSVSAEDEGKTVTVDDSGAWTLGEVGSGLPEVTDVDDGKVLGVDDGEWKAVEPVKSYIPIYSIIIEGSDISNAVMYGDYSEARNRLENGLPIYFIITHYYSATVNFVTFYASAYELDISNKIIIYYSSGRGWYWDADNSLEYFD